MAAQSKFAPPSQLSESSLRWIINDLISLYLKNRKRISRTIYITLFIALINRIRNAILEQKAAAARQAEARRQGIGNFGTDGGTTRKRVELNREFFKNLLRLLRIVIPGWRSKELRLLISHSLFLVLRTLISLYVAELDGKLVSNLVRGRAREFLSGLVWWMVVAVPATFTNSMVLSILLQRERAILVANSCLRSAFIPSMQTCASVQNTAHQPHTQSLFLEHDILRPLNPRRPDQER